MTLEELEQLIDAYEAILRDIKNERNKLILENERIRKEIERSKNNE
ncbi:MAG: hypothetical protein J6U54_18020 [Clostridiales bacterium]|nr:hypothetical protein [Clostridiales bacterium]